ncbi:23S rRNA (uracil(1939)-C(5))-methyltransferase RlmD [Peptoniphilus equinus]|uniref:23S rRNA (Uracil(1939)-C(5))-methyltransferase RlmD n=1 Tax=Peptoniphilus equinus TaxID=3016343 RepID=A0ABY7QTJ3_9FIRM|nr:23S rRNA (uracil(1939)-C(5))-methyltransferase RlmD [Peptoniphilus equinus]WBW49463.1 23S rRNA (uracil(1939)-C(5))-methyltransferase RlmD [Peptoniphilus equinus]
MDIKITDYDHRGRGFGRVDGKSVFIEGPVVLGDTVRGHLRESKKNFDVVVADEIITPSIHRVHAKCPYFYQCGGCDMQNLLYRRQLEFKRDKVQRALYHIGGEVLSVRDTLGIKEPYFYRNHIQLKVRDGILGYYGKGTKDVVPIRHCAIAEPAINTVIPILARWNGLNSVEEVILRANYKGEVMVVLITPNHITKLNNVLSSLLDTAMVSLYSNVRKNSKFRYGKDFVKLYGVDRLEEQLGGHTFYLSPASFFQVNRKSTENLYKTAVALMDVQQEDAILDLYSGIGTLSLLMHNAKSVTGVEIVSAAVDDARENAAAAGYDNLHFISGAVEDTIDALIDRDQGVNKVMVDPPRGGLKASVVAKLNELQAERIVYISCNPATQARDIALLKGYSVTEVVPVDMFCHSVHSESIALLEKIK